MSFWWPPGTQNFELPVATRLENFDTFWAKVNYCLFWVEILEKWDMKSFSSVEGFLLVPAFTLFTTGLLLDFFIFQFIVVI